MFLRGTNAMIHLEKTPFQKGATRIVNKLCLLITTAQKSKRNGRMEGRTF